MLFKKKGKFYKTLWLLCVFVIIICTAECILFCTLSTYYINKVVMQNEYARILRYENNLKNEFKKAESFSQNLSMENDIVKNLAEIADTAGKDTYSIVKFREQISKLKRFGQAYINFYIIFDNIDFCITNEGTCKKEQFYSQIGMNVDKQKYFNNGKYKNEYIKFDDYKHSYTYPMSSLCYAYTVLSNNGRNTGATILIPIILDDSIYSADINQITLLSNEGDILMSYSKDLTSSKLDYSSIKINSKENLQMKKIGKYAVFISGAGFNRWKIVSVIERNAVDMPILIFILSSAFFIIVILIIQLKFYANVINKIYTPVNQLLPYTAGESSELENIKTTFMNLRFENAEIIRQTEKHKKIISNMAMINILKGYNNLENISETFERINIRFPYDYFMIELFYCCGVTEQTERDLINFAIINVVEELSCNMGINLKTVEIDGMVVCIYNTKENSEIYVNEFKQIANRVINVVDENLETSLIVACGNFCDLNSLSESYYSVLNVIKYCIINDLKQVFLRCDGDIENKIDEYEQKEGSAYQDKLYQFINDNNIDGIREVFDSVFEDDSKIQSFDSKKSKLNSFIMTLMNVCLQMSLGVEQKIFQILYKNNVLLKHMNFNVIKDEIIDDICKTLKDNMNTEGSNNADVGNIPFIYRKICEIAENEFGNPNVSSAYIADKCGVSINYVLRIFKKMSGGTSLNAYLSMLRLDNAEKLLRNTTLNINEIAEKSGFFSISTFNRLFKKEYLLTPQQYRKNVYK